MCSGRDAHAHLTLQEWGQCLGSSSSELVFQRDTPCRGVMLVAVSEVWKVARL